MGLGRCRFLGQTRQTRASQPAPTMQAEETDTLRSEVQALRTAITALAQRLENA